jgi:hypothetical protein
MIEIVKDMMDPIYWLTVVPVGTTYLVYMWKRDAKMIAKQRESKVSNG